MNKLRARLKSGKACVNAWLAIPAGFSAEVMASASGTGNEYPLHPAGNIVVDREPGALRVKLHAVKVDAHDLFTGVSSELEQRHEGLRVEIG